MCVYPVQRSPYWFNLSSAGADIYVYVCGVVFWHRYIYTPEYTHLSARNSLQPRWCVLNVQSMLRCIHTRHNRCTQAGITYKHSQSPYTHIIRCVCRWARARCVAAGIYLSTNIHPNIYNLRRLIESIVRQGTGSNPHVGYHPPRWAVSVSSSEKLYINGWS